MGYSTDYYGNIQIAPALNEQEVEEINAWLACRHVTYDVNKIYELDPNADQHTIDGTPVGNGGWNWIKIYADPDGNAYDPVGEAVMEWNEPGLLPSLWSDLEVDETTMCWNGSEKSYEIPAWIQLLIDCVFAPRGYSLNGELEWRGEDYGDTGVITITDNVMEVEPY